MDCLMRRSILLLAVLPSLALAFELLRGMSTPNGIGAPCNVCDEFGHARIIRTNADGSSREPFVSGWLQGESVAGRPVDLIVKEDGSLLVSDDLAGKIYRISYIGGTEQGFSV